MKKVIIMGGNRHGKLNALREAEIQRASALDVLKRVRNSDHTRITREWLRENYIQMFPQGSSGHSPSAHVPQMPSMGSDDVPHPKTMPLNFAKMKRAEEVEHKQLEE